MNPIEFITQRLITIMGMEWSPNQIRDHLRITQKNYTTTTKLSRKQHRQIVLLIESIGRLRKLR